MDSREASTTYETEGVSEVVNSKVVQQAIAPYQATYIPVATQVGPVRHSALPQAPFAAAMGQPRALTRLALATGLRAGIIGVGLYAVGVRKPSQLLLGSLASSATLSLMLTGYHAARTRRTW